MSASALCRFFAALSLVATCNGAKCPSPTPNFKSTGGGSSVSLTVKNEAGVPVLMSWVDFRGEAPESSQHVIEIDESTTINSFIGHSFRIHADVDALPLLQEYTVKTGSDTLIVKACDGIEAIDVGNDIFVSPRQKEMESLMHDPATPCEPAGQSSKWSCLVYTSAEDYSKRSKEKYGFATDSEGGHRGQGATVDEGYTSHITHIPRVADGKGYQVMSFTKKMREILLPWYEEVRKGGPKDAVEVHEPIAGGYTNINNISMSKINLDKFRHVQRALYGELQDMLEWWTGRRLKHTSTFGVRIYHRDSMLINHVDRADTHLASAVIQLDQQTDEDGGWPLEVLNAEGDCTEVYLQPGELVLYEGARFRHGRPMRFQGEYFANIFSHFAPRNWFGPRQSPAYDGKLDKDGRLERTEL